MSKNKDQKERLTNGECNCSGEQLQEQQAEKPTAEETETESGKEKTSEAEEVNQQQEKENEAGAEKDPLTEAQAQIEDLKDKYLRAIAEFDNYKKRTLKEKAELILNGSEKTITALLPILDDMERAIANAGKTESIEKVEEGWELIFKKFIKTLESLGVKKIDTDNKDFDVDFHEAVAMVPGMGDDKKGKVIDCVQTGYTLNDKVIRHAKVAVGQ